ncbi:MAG: MarR family transcriptional regulator [Bdellovibrionota bacterium]
MTSAVNVEHPDIDLQVEFLCIDTSNLWRNRLGNIAKDYNLSRLELRIIVFIGRYPSIRQADLASIMEVEPQSLTRALESMEKKQWIFKGNDEKDKRAKCLNLTPDGQKKLQENLAMSEKIRPKILQNISLEEKNNMVKILSSIKENLKEI